MKNLSYLLCQLLCKVLCNAVCFALLTGLFQTAHAQAQSTERLNQLFGVTIGATFQEMLTYLVDELGIDLENIEIEKVKRPDQRSIVPSVIMNNVEFPLAAESQTGVDKIPVSNAEIYLSLIHI